MDDTKPESVGAKRSRNGHVDNDLAIAEMRGLLNLIAERTERMEQGQDRIERVLTRHSERLDDQAAVSSWLRESFSIFRTHHELAHACVVLSLPPIALIFIAMGCRYLGWWWP